MRYAISCLVILAVPALAHAATLKVPSQYPKIQQAIDAAVEGDTVLVAPGTYVETIDFKGKGITVKSEEGPLVTTLDGNLDGSVVTFKTREDSDSVLDRFEITNGSGTPQFGSYTYGGGIYCRFSSPTIRNNIITGNTTSSIGGAGGGIFCNAA